MELFVPFTKPLSNLEKVMSWITLQIFNDCLKAKYLYICTKERKCKILCGECFLENFLNITCSLTLTLILHLHFLPLKKKDSMPAVKINFNKSTPKKTNFYLFASAECFYVYCSVVLCVNVYIKNFFLFKFH